jgi:hypothetical protein
MDDIRPADIRAVLKASRRKVRERTLTALYLRQPNVSDGDLGNRLRDAMWKYDAEVARAARQIQREAEERELNRRIRTKRPASRKQIDAGTHGRP